MKKLYVLLIATISTFNLFSQSNSDQRIKVFVDCSNSYCDMNYIKTELNYVDYVLDNKVADVHILLTQQSSGGGGSQYQLIFYGQNRFNTTDTLRFNTTSTSTEFEVRNLLIKYLQIGLLPFLSKTRSIESISVTLKNDAKIAASKTAITKDPWNYWVYKIGLNGNVNADANYNSLNYNGNMSASRVTDKYKLSFSVNAGKNNNSYKYDDGTTVSKVVVKNESYDFSHELVKSISEHWSIGYDLGVSRNTFNNYALRSFLRPAVEYDVFKYKDVNNKLFTIRYGLDVYNNQYFDTTLYFKKHETRPGQELDMALTYNQKWGTVNLFSSYHSYLDNIRQYNLSLGGGVNVRISGGLSFNIFVFGNNLRDQIYLPKGEASFQDILTKQRQLATNFSIFSFVGISYRFGSKLNNFVNPRFNSGGGNFFFSN